MKRKCINIKESIPNNKVYIVKGNKKREKICSINLESTLINISTHDLFKNSRIVLFGLPGAFTPTCTKKHVPGYSNLYEDILKYNIDDIYCLSADNPYVMNAWFKKMKITNIKFISDPKSKFIYNIGLDHSIENKGLFNVCWRFSAVINNGIIEQIFCEQGLQDNPLTDPYDCSDAQTMLNYLQNN